jgi:dGTPase
VAGLIDRLVSDLIACTAARLGELGLESAEAVRRHPSKIVGLSPEVDRGRRELKAFLYDRFYNHPRVTRATREAERIVEALFRELARNPEQLPPQVRARFDREGERRAIADYVAGMTDRYAVAEHEKLGHPGEGSGV